MSFSKAKKHLEQIGLADRIIEFDTSSATVELAAKALGTEPGRIAKSLTFQWKDTGVLILAAGDKRMSNSKFKAQFGEKAKMLSPEEVEQKTNHQIGGVCPFGIPEELPVYMDESLRAYDTVYPACGSSNSCAKLTVDELYTAAGAKGWVDVTQ